MRFITEEEIKLNFKNTKGNDSWPSYQEVEVNLK